MKTYIIHFRGHGHLSETKELASTPAGIEAAAKSAAEYWCRSHKSPFAVYTVGFDGTGLVGTVAVDVDAPYTVFVYDSGVRLGHDFRTKKAFDQFCRLCKEKSVAHDGVVWLKKKKPSRVAG